LDDKAARIADALKPKAPKAPGDPAMAKVKSAMEKIAAQTAQMQSAGGPKPESLTRELAERSKNLAALGKEAKNLYQVQRKMQNGVALDESAKLDRNLANLGRNLGRKGGEVVRQVKSFEESIGRQEATLQKSLDRLKENGAKATERGSADAKAIAETLAPVPDKAAGLTADPSAWKGFRDRVERAREQAADWSAKTTGQARPRTRLLAEAGQQLRKVSAAMADAGLSSQNADSAAAMLAEMHPETPSYDLSTLESAVAAAETLHGQIETDFQSLRAAEIATRSGQSFEEMQHQAAANTDQKTAIEVPDANTAISTIGDLNAYRKAMDSAVAQTEGLAQKSRTMQRQALGQADPGLARAMKKARAAAQRQKAGARSRAEGNGDKRRTAQDKKHTNPKHQMTFDATPVRAKRLEVDKIKAKALPGRRFTEESSRRGWLYVDTWYVIGPWENNGKVDWSDIHAPEFEVDLAKIYSGGKGNRKLRWQFTQNPTIRCDPPDEQPNSTYYAYTEVYFDQAREMLVAIASDDAAKLWINDKLVWQDEGLSVWNMDEGFRRVHFKKGFSKILMRIENGPGFCQYSMLLCPPDI